MAASPLPTTYYPPAGNDGKSETSSESSESSDESSVSDGSSCSSSTLLSECECLIKKNGFRIIVAALVVMSLMVMWSQALGVRGWLPWRRNGAATYEGLGVTRAAIPVEPWQKELAGAGWVVYYLKGCHFCEDQKRALGGTKMFPQYVELDRNRNVLHAGVNPLPIAAHSGVLNMGFPFWYNTKTGAHRVGYQSNEALFEMIGRSILYPKRPLYIPGTNQAVEYDNL